MPIASSRRPSTSSTSTTETEQPSQGTLDFDDDQVEEDPNEHRLRDLAIIRSLAVTLGPIIDEREPMLADARD